MSATYIACMGIMQTENGLKIKINYTVRWSFQSYLEDGAHCACSIYYYYYFTVYTCAHVHISLYGYYMLTIILTYTI